MLDVRRLWCFMRLLAGMLALVGSLSPAWGLELIKTGEDVRPDRISFTNVQYEGLGNTVYLRENPLLEGTSLFGPQLMRESDRWLCYCGGRLVSVGGYTIVRARSNTLNPGEGWQAQTIIRRGDFERVYDPTVVNDPPGQWVAVYTTRVIEDGSKREWLAYSTSTDGVDWTPDRASTTTALVVNDPGSVAPGALGELRKAALLRDGSTWRMWLEAETADGLTTHSYYAESTQPLPTGFDLVHRFPDIDGQPGFSDPDVLQRPGGGLIACVERGNRGLYFATSSDGINFEFTPALDIDDPLVEPTFLSSPALLYDQTSDVLHGLAFGGRFQEPLITEQIAFSYLQYRFEVVEAALNPRTFTAAEPNSFNEQSLIVSFPEGFSKARVFDPATGRLLLTQPIPEAQVGDEYFLDRSNAASRGALLR